MKKVFIAGLISFIVCSCGQSGRLYLPEKSNPASIAQFVTVNN